MVEPDAGRDDEAVVVEIDELTYARHARRLTGLASALVGPSAAEDVVSAAVLRAMSSPGWPTVVDRGAYLTRAVVNEARSSYRSALRREAREQRAAPRLRAAEGADPVPEVLAALAHLPIRQRAAVFLTYWADMTPTAVADHLGIGEGSVRKHLARARATLRKELT